MMAKTATPETTETLAQDAKQARVAAILAQLAPYADQELPPDLQEWLGQFVGRSHVSFPFNADTYFDEQVLYD
jgi:hypothetical protein